MIQDELAHLDIQELAHRYRTRDVSPVDVTRGALDRIARSEPLLNAYILVTRDRAMADARRAEARLQSGEPCSPLCGIPISLKDIIDVEGLPLTCASDVLKQQHYVSARTGHVAQRLFAAGAVFLGKNNMLEFAYGETHPSFGYTHNPWNLERSTMGSSTGSAATVAAGQAFVSIGTDTGGSVRLPASYCGLIGLKPTYGLVSRDGVIPLSWSCDHVGPLTHTAMEAAIVMNEIAGYDPGDPTSADVLPRDFVAALGRPAAGLRLGVVTYPADQVDSAVRDAIDRAIGTLSDLGMDVQEVRLDGLDEAAAALAAVFSVEAASYHEQWLQATPELYSVAVRHRLMLGALIPAIDYVRAQRFRRAFCGSVTAALEKVDALVLPAATSVAHRLADERQGRDLAPIIRFTGPFNLSGNPAVSVPCGVTSEDNLPVAMQLVGRPFEDETLLLIAHRYQDVTEWHRRRPPEVGPATACV